MLDVYSSDQDVWGAKDCVAKVTDGADAHSRGASSLERAGQLTINAQWGYNARE